MSSIVKMGSALYFKSGAVLERDEMDELAAVKAAFEKSGDEFFVFDLSSLERATNRACNLLASIQEEARRKGKVCVLMPKDQMGEQLLSWQAIRTSEIYKDRAVIGQMMKEKTKGLIPS